MVVDRKKSGSSINMAKPRKVLGRSTRGLAAKRLVEDDDAGTPPASSKKGKKPDKLEKKPVVVPVPCVSPSASVGKTGRGRAGRPKKQVVPSPKSIDLPSAKPDKLLKSTTPKKKKAQVKRQLEEQYIEPTEDSDNASEISEGNLTADKIRSLVQDELNNSNIEDKRRPNKIGRSNDYIEDDSDDDNGAVESDEENEAANNVSLGNMVLDEEVFDETTPVKDLYTGDKEEELCRLWEEEKSLYISSEPGYRDPNHRRDVIRRMALLLQIRRK